MNFLELTGLVCIIYLNFVLIKIRKIEAQLKEASAKIRHLEVIVADLEAEKEQKPNT